MRPFDFIDKQHTMEHIIPICADVRISDNDESLSIETEIPVSDNTYGELSGLAEDVLMNLSEPLVLTDNDVCNLERDEVDYFSDLEILEKITAVVMKSYPGQEIEIKYYTIPVICFQR